MPLLVAIVASLALASAAQAGQIIYSNGGNLWAVNDNGTGTHELVSQAQVGGAIPGPLGQGVQALSVQPNATTIVFDASTPASDGNCIENCPGLYSLINGNVTRLSTAPSDPCGNNPSLTCFSQDDNPALLPGGTLVYETIGGDNDIDIECYYYCSTSSGYTLQLWQRQPDGSNAPTAWQTPPSSAPYSDQPNALDGPLAVDPVQSAVLAWDGQESAAGASNPTCSTGSSTTGNCYPMDVENLTGPQAVNQPAMDDSQAYGMSFSANGAYLATLETGGDKGIWVYDAASSDPNAKVGAYVLQDPDNSASNPYTLAISDITFIGSSELAFAYDNNIYTLPSTCFSTMKTYAKGSAATPNCTLAQASQLTSDGTSSAPDLFPVWTSSTTAIPAAGSNPAPTPTGTSTTPTPTSTTQTTKTTTTPVNSPAPTPDPLTKLKLLTTALKPHQPLEISLKLATKETVHLVLYGYVARHGRTKAHYKGLATQALSEKAGSHTLKLTKVGHRTFTKGKYELTLAAPKRVHTLKFSVS